MELCNSYYWIAFMYLYVSAYFVPFIYKGAMRISKIDGIKFSLFGRITIVVFAFFLWPLYILRGK